MVVSLIQLNGLDVDSLKAIFARNLEYAMKESGVNQSELAEAVGVSSGMVSRWVNGHSLPDSVVIDEMRRIYSWTTRDLFEENPDEPPPVNTASALKAIAEALGYERPRLRRKA